MLKKLKPVFEKRIENSALEGYTGTIGINCYTSKICISWDKGKIIDISYNKDETTPNIFNIPNDLFCAVVLGYNYWRNLHMFRPDISLTNQFTDPDNENIKLTGDIIDVLFPPVKSWIYLQY